MAEAKTRAQLYLKISVENRFGFIFALLLADVSLSYSAISSTNFPHLSDEINIKQVIYFLHFLKLSAQ
ncbi:MAG: hypothetical protein A4E19_03330 [Nitrospira sp. SG-bin1]|nr:MAG: hypothetical protein A4E19_03330 [Nitrospira sp. SG-bin1]